MPPVLSLHPLKYPTTIRRFFLPRIIPCDIISMNTNREIKREREIKILLEVTRYALDTRSKNYIYIYIYSNISHSIFHLSKKSHTILFLFFFFNNAVESDTAVHGHRFARLRTMHRAVSGNSERDIRGGTWPSRRRRRDAHLRRGPAHLVSRPSCLPSSSSSSSPLSANARHRLPRELLASRNRTQSPLGDPNTRPARPRCFPIGWPRFGIVRVTTTLSTLRVHHRCRSRTVTITRGGRAAPFAQTTPRKKKN